MSASSVDAPARSTGEDMPTAGRAAFLVAAGIFLSRIFGLVRQRVFAHYLGTSDAADAFTAAFRIPNILQNLFGEGVLSASFIPVYAGLHGRRDEEGRRDVAAAVLSLLIVAMAVFVLLGIALAPELAALLGPGYGPAKRALITQLVRVLFPGAAIFVLSAWSLGVLNTHGRFFLSYVSQVFWNVAMIATLLFFGGRSGQERLVYWLAWGSVAGSLLQFGVQLPLVLRYLGGLRFRWLSRSPDVRTVVRNFVPIFIGRGVSQISGLVDASIASLLGQGALATLAYAQLLYMLPVSLFGMSVSAAELPAMSGFAGADHEVADALRGRLDAGLRRIAFFVVPSAAAFLIIGDAIGNLIYRGGQFGPEQARLVWAALAGASVGLVARTLGRLYSSAFYAMRDARTPLRFALIRVVLSTALGASLSLLGPRLLGVDPQWGVAGITVASGFAGWVEFLMLRRALGGRIGHVTVPRRHLAVLWSGAVLAGGVAYAAGRLNAGAPALVRAALVLGLFGMVYWVFTWRLGIPEANELRRRVFRRAR